MPSCVDKITFVQDIIARVINVSLSTEGACTSPEYNLSAAACMASLTGTFVCSYVTSNEMITSSGSSLIPETSKFHLRDPHLLYVLVFKVLIFLPMTL